jgi:general secretion pathway protein D
MMKANYRLKRLSTLPIVTLLIASCHSGHSAFKSGNLALASRNYEQAMQQYKIALDQEPENNEYRMKYEQSRFSAAFQHFDAGRRAFEATDLETARKEFTRSIEIDPTNGYAELQLQRVNAAISARDRGQPEPGRDFEQMRENTRTDPTYWLQGQLQPTVTGPISTRLVQDSRVAFETLANLAGLNVIFDAQFRPVRVQLELTGVNIFEALDILSLQTTNFWKPINKTTILVAPDNQTARRQYEDYIFKTFYMTNSVTTTEITEAITALRTLLNMSFIAQSTANNAILLRDTPDKIAIAEQILDDIDKAKPEVVVDVLVLEVDRNTLFQLGIQPPSSTTLTFVPPGTTTTTTGTGTTGTTTTTTTTTNNNVALRNLNQLNSQNFQLSIPPTTAEFLASNSKTKLLQNPRVRATDNKQASIRIGSRVPVAQGSFQPAFAGATGTPVVQFQYVDIGVNLDILARVLLTREVDITTTVQISALAGSSNLGGLTLPVFTNRQVTHEIRLAEGETNLLGGVITDTEQHSMSGLPGLKDIPILKYFFAVENKQRDQTEIIILLTPHIVRMPNIKESNLRGLNVGSVNLPHLHFTETPATPRTPAAPTPAPAPTPIPPPPGQSNLGPAVPPPPPSVSPTPTNTTIAFSPTPMTLTPAPPTGTPSQPQTINIVANGSIFAADLVLSFDPQAVSIAQIREGGFLSKDGQLVSMVQRVETDTGMVRISLERPPAAPPVSGTGTLVQLVLEPGSHKGPSTIKVTDFQVRDARGIASIGKGVEVQVNVP